MDYLGAVRIVGESVGLLFAGLIYLVIVRSLRGRWKDRTRPLGNQSHWFCAAYLILVGPPLAVAGYQLLSGAEPARLFLLLAIVPPVVLALFGLTLNDRAMPGVERLVRRGRPDEAIAALQAALARERPAPTSRPDGLQDSAVAPIARFGPRRRRADRLERLGLLLVNRGDLSAAVQSFEEAIRVGGPTTSRVAQLGSALMQSGRFEEGLTTIQRAIAGVEPLEQVQWSIMLTVLLTRLRRWVEAHDALDRATSSLEETRFLTPAHRGKLERVILTFRNKVLARVPADLETR